MNQESREKFTASEKPETRGLLDSLKESVGKSKLGQEYDKLKKSVTESVLFEGRDSKGKVFDKVKVKDVFKNPWNLVKGLALEYSGSFPMLQELYKFVLKFVDTEEKAGLEDDDRVVENLDKEYLRGKNIDIKDLEGFELSPKENQICMDIIEEGGFDVVKGLEFYEKNKLGIKNMSRSNYLTLMRESVLQAKRFNIPTELYVPYILGMTKTESSFRVNAHNKSGATGLHQHMPQFFRERYYKNKSYLEQRGLNYEFVEPGINEINRIKKRSDYKNWPPNMWSYMSDIRVQSALTGQLTKQNIDSVMSRNGLKSYELVSPKRFFQEVYFCHNMGAGNLRLMEGYVYGGGDVNELKNKYGEKSWVYRRIAFEKPWEKTSQAAMKAYEELYKNQNIV